MHPLLLQTKQKYSPAQNSLTTCRDAGLNLLRNTQFTSKPDWCTPDDKKIVLETFVEDDKSWLMWEHKTSDWFELSSHKIYNKTQYVQNYSILQLQFHFRKSVNNNIPVSKSNFLLVFSKLAKTSYSNPFVTNFPEIHFHDWTFTTHRAFPPESTPYFIIWNC